MGYRPRRKRFRLVFPAGSDLDGLEIDVRSLTLGEARQLEEPLEGEGRIENDERFIAAFLGQVDVWTLEDEGGATMPITRASLDALNPADVSLAVQLWFKRCMGSDVADPLPSGSGGGSTTDRTDRMEASLPMDSPPESLAS